MQGLDPFPSLLFTHNEIENEAILPAGEVHHSGGDLLPVSGVSQDRALQDPEELQPGDHQQDPDYAGVSSADLQSWRAQVAKFHRAAGHPIARNLARMLQDAQIERWKIKEALQYRCPVCEEHKPGGKSSRQVAPMSIRPLPQPWEHLGIDITEWEVPGIDLKVKFMVMMDMATHYRVTETLATYPYSKTYVETADDVLRVLLTRWIMDKPKPKILIPDNANTFLSQKVVEFCADVGITVMPPPDNESWAHGVVERTVQHLKEAANRIYSSSPDLPPAQVVALATSALNSTEFHRGYTSLQWAFGQQTTLTEEELRQQISLPVERQQDQYLRLLSQREAAEQHARKARATLLFSKLKNTSIKQPVRTFHMAQPVMVWRKFLPHTIYKGRKGGRKHTAKPRWVGPGRVVFHELVPGQTESDRKQIVWVILGNILYRASVHSVRPLSAREQELHEAHGDESHRWKELTDMIPRRNYVDIEPEQPEDGEIEEPYLPPIPGPLTMKPKMRFWRKDTMSNYGDPLSQRLQRELPALPPEVPFEIPNDKVNEYDSDVVPSPSPPCSVEEIPSDRDAGSKPTSRRTSLASAPPIAEEPDGGEHGPPQPAAEVVDDTPVPEPDQKKAKLDDEGEADALLDFNSAILESGEGYFMSLDLDLSSNRQRKMFLNNPVAFLAKKLNNAEVVYRRLSEEDKKLFTNAKAAEVSSFLKTAAVRRCLSHEENLQAQNSGRVLKARWVLVWKAIPGEDRSKALDLRAADPENTTVNADGTQKAKARIVVLGFQHPDLASTTFRSSAPVQSQLMRNLALCVTSQRNWVLESLDMSTAFLQAGAQQMEEEKLYTSGVPELKQALGASDTELLRLVKNIYGNSTAPRGLWQDVDATFKKLGAHRIVGDASFWVWTVPNPKPMNKWDQNILLGYVGGHVDDFTLSGDLQDHRWMEIRKQILQAYKWGSQKQQSFRHTGVDLEIMEKGSERWAQLSQDFYMETLQDLTISPERLRGDPKAIMTDGEVAVCRASLGALQWVATQTQLQACARVNLLLTELTVNRNIMVAKEIQSLIKEIRSEPVTLKMWRIPEIQHWQDAVIVTLADQAHANRPQGGSTGGYITFIGGPQHAQGEAGRLNILSWRSWRLKRKAISTNDGEIQSMVEGEDANFRTRFLWCQLNGCILKEELLDEANDMVTCVRGILGTDSRGGFDAIMKNESPLLGPSNIRNALQAFQLREQIKIAKTTLIWLSGDWNLSDALTKKDKTARAGLMQFLRNWMWKLSYDPNFIQSERKSKRLGQGAVTQMRQLQSLVPWTFMDDLETFSDA